MLSGDVVGGGWAWFISVWRAIKRPGVMVREVSYLGAVACEVKLQHLTAQDKGEGREERVERVMCRVPTAVSPASGFKLIGRSGSPGPNTRPARTP